MCKTGGREGGRGRHTVVLVPSVKCFLYVPRTNTEAYEAKAHSRNDDDDDDDGGLVSLSATARGAYRDGIEGVKIPYVFLPQGTEIRSLGSSFLPPRAFDRYKDFPVEDIGARTHRRLSPRPVTRHSREKEIRKATIYAR